MNSEHRVVGVDSDLSWEATLSPPVGEAECSVEVVFADVRFEERRSDVRLFAATRTRGSAMGAGFGGVDDMALLAGSVAVGLFALWKRRARSRAASSERPSPQQPTFAEAWRVDDPSGIIDDRVAAMLLNPPTAPHPAGKSPRPISIGSIHLRPVGLRVLSDRWWASADALAYQLEVGLVIARRVIAAQRDQPTG
jgi:hypothetical protein